MRLSEKTDKLFPALFRVKQELGPVVKGAVNPHFRSKFADLNTHIETVEPVLEKHGLMLLQPPTTSANGSNVLVTMIVHAESGQFIESELTLVNVPDMQKVLAGITYARRGSINSMLGLASEDDDGETTVGRGKSFGKPAASQAPSTPTKSSFRVSKKPEPSATAGDDSGGSSDGWA